MGQGKKGFNTKSLKNTKSTKKKGAVLRRDFGGFNEFRLRRRHLTSVVRRLFNALAFAFLLRDLRAFRVFGVESCCLASPAAVFQAK
jgi:hypothetical protein